MLGTSLKITTLLRYLKQTYHLAFSWCKICPKAKNYSFYNGLQEPVLCALKWELRRWTWQKFNMPLQSFWVFSTFSVLNKCFRSSYSRKEKTRLFKVWGIINYSVFKRKAYIQLLLFLSLKTRSHPDVSKYSSVWVYTPIVANQNLTWLNVRCLPRVQNEVKLKKVSSLRGSCCMLNNWKHLASEPGFHILDLSLL